MRIQYGNGALFENHIRTLFALKYHFGSSLYHTCFVKASVSIESMHNFADKNISCIGYALFKTLLISQNST